MTYADCQTFHDFFQPCVCITFVFSFFLLIQATTFSHGFIDQYVCVLIISTVALFLMALLENILYHSSTPSPTTADSSNDDERLEMIRFM